MVKSLVVGSVVTLSLLTAACTGEGLQSAEIPDEIPSAEKAKDPGTGTGTIGGTSTETQTKVPTPPSQAACASASIEATLKPLNLVFMVDRSGSMGDSTAKRTAKWNPVVGAMKTFFGDKGAKGVSASMQYFPQGDPDDNDYCRVSTYAKPSIGLTALPSAAFATSLDKTSPTAEGTPAAPALRGALEAADIVLASKKEAVAVVLVTDGDPNKCDSSAAAVAQVAAAYKSKIKTYVIGVGNVPTLNQIAAAGGTTSAVVVNLANPAQTQTDFVAAVQKIRGAALPCELELPKAKEGETLDYAKVNLNLTSSAGLSELSYSKDCSNTQGWRYDDAAKPSKVILCQKTCDTAKEGGKLSVTLGCATKGDSPR